LQVAAVLELLKLTASTAPTQPLTLLVAMAAAVEAQVQLQQALVATGVIPEAAAVEAAQVTA
jgi:hypothetical protein